MAFPKLRSIPEEREKPIAIQVKTSTHHGPDNDKWIEWNVSEDCPADYIVLVDLIRNKFWLISIEEFKEIASRAAVGQLRLWWSLPGYEAKRTKRREEQFKDFEMDTGIHNAFGINQ